MGMTMLSSWVAVNVLNKKLLIAEKGWSSSLEVGRVANNTSPLKSDLLRNITQPRAGSFEDGKEPSVSIRDGGFS